MLAKKSREKNIATYIHETRRSQEQMVLLHLSRMDDREVTPDAALAQVPVRPLELLLLRVVQVGHAAGQVDEVQAAFRRLAGSSIFAAYA